jgi:hypothetical protein
MRQHGNNILAGAILAGAFSRHRRVSTGRNGEDGHSHFAGFWL